MASATSLAARGRPERSTARCQPERSATGVPESDVGMSTNAPGITNCVPTFACRGRARVSSTTFLLSPCWRIQPEQRTCTESS